MSAALGLYRLQQIDLAMAQVRARLDAIQALLANDSELLDAVQQAETAAALRATAETDLARLEGESQALRIKIEQTEASLYGGAVHNPKELQDLQLDVAALKRHLAVLEDRQLEQMLVVEAASQADQQAAAQLEGIRSQRGQQQVDLAGEQTHLTRDLDRLAAERAAAESSLPDDQRALYDGLREDKRGVAVAALAENACGACGTNLTPAQLQSVRISPQPVFCPTCGRVLYAG